MLIGELNTHRLLPLLVFGCNIGFRIQRRWKYLRHPVNSSGQYANTAGVTVPIFVSRLSLLSYKLLFRLLLRDVDISSVICFCTHYSSSLTKKYLTTLNKKEGGGIGESLPLNPLPLGYPHSFHSLDCRVLTILALPYPT